MRTISLEESLRREGNAGAAEEIEKLRAEVSRLTAELAEANERSVRLLELNVFANGELKRLTAELAELRSQEPVARLLLGIGSDLYLKGRTIARTYDELAENRYPEAWQEGEKLYASPVPAAQAVPDGLRGFSIWLNREEWGAVIDGLILERERSDERKAVNSESTSNVRADMCVSLIKQIGEASDRAMLAAAPTYKGEQK